MPNRLELLHVCLPTGPGDSFLAAQGLDRSPSLASMARDWWTRLAPHIRAARLDLPGRPRLAAWLDRTGVELCRQARKDSPTAGYVSEVIATALVMVLVARLVPETARHGCAPLPAPAPGEAEPLAELGLSRGASQALTQPHAVLTPMPWAGGCKICLLAKSCPKRKTRKETPKETQ